MAAAIGGGLERGFAQSVANSQTKGNVMPAWTKETIDRVSKKVAKEAERAAGRLGARCAVMIAIYADKDGVHHMIDAGQSPIPVKDLYERLLVKIYDEEKEIAAARAAADALMTPVQ